MSTIPAMIKAWEFNRGRTTNLLDVIEKTGKADAVLGYRPGAGRAHIAWQIMHVGITEELFATQRLKGTEPAYADLVPRFKGGSIPDDQIPSLSQIRDVLAQARAHLLETVSGLSESDLGTIPPAFAERGWNIGQLLNVIAWHEGHHQGQAHITFNLWKANQPIA